MSNVLITTLLIVFLSFASTVQAELVVIGHKSLDSSGMTKKNIIDIYMGRYSLLSENVKLIPLDQAENSKIKKSFYKKLVNRSLNEIEAYWARLIFSGRAKRPQSVDGDKQVIAKILKNPSMIGYIDSSRLSNDIKVLSYVE